MGISLTVQQRDPERTKAQLLRRQGHLPGMVYGYRVEHQPIVCEYKQFHQVFLKAGESTIIDLELDGQTIPVLIHELTLDPVTSSYLHVDFFAPNMEKEVTAPIPLRPVGEPPAVRELGAVLVRNRETVTVSCLPRDLPHDLPVDLSNLKNFHDAVTVAQLKVPPKVNILEATTEVLFVVQPPRKEEEAPVAAEAAAAAPVEGAPEGEAPPTAEAGVTEGKKEREDKEEEKRGKKREKKEKNT